MNIMGITKAQKATLPASEVIILVQDQLWCTRMLGRLKTIAPFWSRIENDFIAEIGLELP
jgi:hypothetical protein